jgi:large subunit ribosomal protein L17
MRHRARVHHFGRETGPRTAMFRGLVTSLVEHGQIKTTLAKAKELRRHVEKAVTMGKKETLHARRVLLARYPNKDTVSKLVTDLSGRFKTRNGGYTRILKVGLRPGDKAEMALIQFVDYAPVVKTEADLKEVAQAKKRVARAAGKKKKHIRKIQGASRRVARS